MPSAQELWLDYGHAKLHWVHSSVPEKQGKELQAADQRHGEQRGALPQASLGLFPFRWSNLHGEKYLDAHKVPVQKYFMFASANVVQVGISSEHPRALCTDSLLQLQPAVWISHPFSAKPGSSWPLGKPLPGSKTTPSPDPPHLIHTAKDKSSVL